MCCAARAWDRLQKAPTHAEDLGILLRTRALLLRTWAFLLEAFKKKLTRKIKQSNNHTQVFLAMAGPEGKMPVTCKARERGCLLKVKVGAPWGSHSLTKLQKQT